jgi:NAD(P)-dependent dehydrogenase (short-subunit alcohol dehydrogenase family)
MSMVMERVALVTGGTRGLGLAIGRELARAGWRVVLTHKWGGADDEQIAAEFRARELFPPLVVASDAGDPEAVRELMEEIRARRGRLDAIVSNVAFAKIARDLDDLRRSAFELSLRYSAWPVVDLVQAAIEVLGGYPRYVVGVSSFGVETCPDGYDLAGAGKAVMETLCRYLALRLKPHGVRVNVIKPGFLDTESSRATFGDAVIDRLHEAGMVLDPEGAARACVALCSGLLDAVTGQVLVVDEGWSVVNPMAYLTGRGLLQSFPRGDPWKEEKS